MSLMCRISEGFWVARCLNLSEIPQIRLSESWTDSGPEPLPSALLCVAPGLTVWFVLGPSAVMKAAARHQQQQQQQQQHHCISTAHCSVDDCKTWPHSYVSRISDAAKRFWQQISVIVSLMSGIHDQTLSVNIQITVAETWVFFHLIKFTVKGAILYYH